MSAIFASLLARCMVCRPGDSEMEIFFSDRDGERFKLELLSREPQLILGIGAERVAVSPLSGKDPSRVAIRLDDRVLEGWRYVSGNDIYLHLEGRHWHFRRAGIEAGELGSDPAAAELRADMPGTVVSVHAAPGLDVAEGDRLMVIESMKLQMILTAPRAARVKGVHVSENSSFDRGAVLISFEAAEAAARGN